MKRDVVWMLKQLIKTQIDEDRNLYLDKENQRIVTVAHKGQSQVSTPIKKYATSAEALVSYLCTIGCVDRGDSYLKVTPCGWRYLHDKRMERITSVLTGVVFPLIVSFLTTLVTLWITGLF